MPNALHEFTAFDWVRLRPLVHHYKHARFLMVYARVLRRPALAGDVGRAISTIAGARVLTTIAFHDVEKIALQVKAVRRFVKDCVHIIADNSVDDERAARIERAALSEGAIYLRLPRGPWTGGNAGLGHGLAMTWVWCNVIKPGRPQSFGFLDHDIYPTRDDDPFAALADYPVAGRVWMRPPKWHLWAGFCFFRFDDVADKRLNFIRDWFSGLDTGGGNWWPLYRDLDPARVFDPGAERVAILPGVPTGECSVEWLGPWLHEATDWRYLSGPLPQDFKATKFAAVSDIVNARLSE